MSQQRNFNKYGFVSSWHFNYIKKKNRTFLSSHHILTVHGSSVSQEVAVGRGVWGQAAWMHQDKGAGPPGDHIGQDHVGLT